MKNNNRKFVLIIIINILFITIILTLTSFFIDFQMRKEVSQWRLMQFNIFQNNYNESQINLKKYDYEKNQVICLTSDEENFNRYCGEQRVKFGEEYDKAPIILLGGSYAYGHGLKREQTFSYLLSNITKRPIYNFSNCGDFIWISLNNIKSLYGINNNDLNKLKDSEYVIYIYMHDHINRFLVLNHMYNFYEYLISPKTNVLVKNILKIPVFRFLFIEYKINSILNYGKNIEDINVFVENSSKFLKNSILISYEHIKEIAPNAKFIIILYDEKIPENNGNLKIMYDSEIMNSHIWQELKDETDIEVIHTKDITGFVFYKDYKLKEDIADWHPNEKAWAVFTPKFAKKYIN